MKSRSSNPDEGNDSSELERFRQEWLAELRTRRGSQSTHADNDTSNSQVLSEPGRSSASTIGKALPAGIPEETAPGPSSQVIAGTPASVATVTTASLNGPSPIAHPGLAGALDLYRRAVEHEARGKLEDAMVLYRQAFRMNDNVDKAYMRQEMILSIKSSNTEQKHHKKKSSDFGHDELADKMKKSLHIRKTSASIAPASESLATLVKNFPEGLKFEPEEEGESVPLNVLPDEMLIHILLLLDPASLERFARTSRKARLLTLEPALWRRFVVGVYRPPQIEDLEDLEAVIERSLYDYRRVFIEQPRVRFDGVYIATCHYVRSGLSENSWVNISHLITYHRYLRFMPGGQVLSLLVNEEFEPQQVLPILKPSLRMKGFYIGRWRLEDTTIHLDNLLDASGKFHIPSSGDMDDMSASMHAEAVENMRYAFQMKLELASKPLGRWNKANIQTYDSVNLRTGDICPVGLKHERPFWFSKVRSYTLY